MNPITPFRQARHYGTRLKRRGCLRQTWHCELAWRRRQSARSLTASPPLLTDRREIGIGSWSPCAIWNAREHIYRESLVRIEELRRLESDVQWLKEIPLSVLIERGNIQQDQDQRSLVRQALRFFGVSSVEAWHNTWYKPSAQYHSGSAQQKHPGYVAAWLRLGEIQAEAIATGPFDAARFKTVLIDAEKLTLVSTKDAMRQLAATCASVGVAVVLTKEIPGASVSGAVRWLNKTKR